MMNGISGMSGAGWMQRPDPSQMASKLFSKLDTGNNGYLEQSDLQSALDKIGGGDGSSDSVSQLFSKLDGDGDGKITKDEMTESFKKLSDQLDEQFNTMRMQGGMQGGMGAMGGMPPGPPPGPPPGGAGNAGFSKEELQTQLDEIGTSDSERSSVISNIVKNFDEADSDGDGKVSLQEAMAYRDKQADGSEATGSAQAGSTTSADNSERKLMMQLMKLVHAYGDSGDGSATLSSLLNTEA